MKHFVFLMTIIASFMMWSCTTDSLDQENKLMETNDEQFKAIDADGKATYFASPSEEIRVEYATIDEINQAFIDAGMEPYFSDDFYAKIETRGYYCNNNTITSTSYQPTCKNCPGMVFWLDVNGNGVVSTQDLVLMNRVRLGLPVNWPGPLKTGHQDGIMGNTCRTAFNNGINCEDFDAIGGYILGFYGCN